LALPDEEGLLQDLVLRLGHCASLPAIALSVNSPLTSRRDFARAVATQVWKSVHFAARTGNCPARFGLPDRLFSHPSDKNSTGFSQRGPRCVAISGCFPAKKLDFPDILYFSPEETQFHVG
ncbi:MAG TPA: hypothetical protein VFD26_06300, partial [Methyloceanibacter sp.]|nr:hypothetical protein [Methyloceanibacter sp.]